MGSSSVTLSATMKMVMVLLFMVFAVSSALDTWRTDEEVMSMYEQWLVKQGKVYNALGEKKKRFQIFKDNLRYIDEQNSLNRTYKLGLTPFTDLTNEEFRAKYSGTLEVNPKLKLAKTSNRYAPQVGDNLPDYFDWRAYGAVTRVKNQGQCQSCWAFSANGAVEGLHKILTGELISLSEQELVDCNQGCDPGYLHLVFEYMINNRGITAEVNYPYTSYNSVVGYCNQNQIYHIVGIDGYEYVPSYNEAAIKKAVVYQPVSAAVEAYGQDFQHYVSGIFYGNCGTQTNHFALIIGYGSEYGNDYWIIKNSWSPNWGENGFMRLQRNSNSKLGKCGIATQVVYPVIYNGSMKPLNACNNGTSCAQ